MKTSRFLRAVAVTAAAAMTAVGLTTVSIAPATAAGKSLVRIVTSNVPSSLNPSVRQQNLSINSNIAYLTSTGFGYYDSKPSWVKNTDFGTYSVTSTSPFTVKYTIKPGQVYSDGTAIDANDMLASYVITSGKFADAGWNGFLGDLEFLDGLPKVSDDKLSITYVWKTKSPDWEIYAPGPSAIHATVKLAFPSDSATRAKARWLEMIADAQKGDYTDMKKVAAKWNTAYNILNTTGVNLNTDKDLLVSSGPFIVTSAEPGKSVTLKANPSFKQKTRTPKMQTVQFKVIDNTTAAAQALQNREIDLFDGQPTIDAVAAMRKYSGVTVVGGKTGTYEHFDFNITAADSQFAGMSQKAKDLRRAMLLTIPREDIIAKQVAPLGVKDTLDSLTGTFSGDPSYGAITKASGVAEFKKPIATRLAAAKALLAKHGYSVSKPLTLRLLWGSPANTRRSAEAQLMTASAKKVGINVVAPGSTTWGSQLGTSSWDAYFFAWQKTSLTYGGPRENFGWDSAANEGLGNNVNNYNGGAAFNATLDKLQTILSPAEVTKIVSSTEKQLLADGVTLPIFVHPGIVAYDSRLKGVKMSPLSPTVVWNYWEWSW